jgi:hypothetical protein
MKNEFIELKNILTSCIPLPQNEKEVMLVLLRARIVGNGNIDTRMVCLLVVRSLRINILEANLFEGEDGGSRCRPSIAYKAKKKKVK